LIIAKTVTFQEALNLTLQNNKELKAKEYESKKSIEDLKEAQGYKKGKLEFSEQISRTNNAGYVFGMKLASREATFGDFGFNEFDMSGATNPLPVAPKDLNYPEARNNFETKLTFEMPLYTGGKLESAAAMAKLQIKANQAKFLHDKKQIGLEVLKAYNGAVAAKKFINMTKNAKVITSRFNKKAQELYDRKLVRIIDVKQSKMAAYSVDAKIEEAQTKFKLAIAYLQFLTNDKTITDVEEFTIFSLDKSTLDTLQKDAISTRDDYKWMQLNTDTMKKKIVFDGAAEKPMVGTHFEYGMNNDTLNTPFNIHENDYYVAAIGLTYTLFDGDITKAKKQKAKIDYLKTKNYFEYMKEGINLQVKKNYLDFQTQTSTLKQKVKTQAMAEDILKETEDMFANNLKFRTNMMYLLMQLENMLKVQADVIMSQYDQTITSAKLKLSIGSSLKR
ncbi:MAG: TolC family protein, partial [Campylobacteraceae bacterium]|nr:TolC family protein [Campylobacteraceae bacterium]